MVCLTPAPVDQEPIGFSGNSTHVARAHITENNTSSQAWWCPPVTPVKRSRGKQVFVAILVYTASSMPARVTQGDCLKRQRSERWKEEKKSVESYFLGEASSLAGHLAASWLLLGICTSELSTQRATDVFAMPFWERGTLRRVRGF